MSCASFGAAAVDAAGSKGAPPSRRCVWRASTRLKTIVETVRPKAVPICAAGRAGRQHDRASKQWPGRGEARRGEARARTWVIVWNSAPATLCSCGRATFAMKSVPAANTKSAPKTEKMAAGKPKAQYGALGSISAKKTLAKEVKSVPTTVRARV